MPDAPLTDPHPAASSTDGGFAGGPATVPVAAGPPGYELLSEVGRGGMGVVHRARDAAVRRDVAVKVLADRYPPDGAAARRFLAEARITGQLQHPGIPAVYQVGALPDGRPFLAMKLIKGQTLADLLAAGAERGRLVAAFEGVCQAVGYAHSRGVIHRDLKPANVMVGAFGEVQVMDWGLAKTLVSREAESAEPSADPDATADPVTEVRDDRDPTDATRDGDVLGTPAYMAPEQAAGAAADLDRRADVFGLGAMLCALLTGRPPFVGSDAVSTRLMAARADLADALARLDGSGADPELVALCKRCLSPRREDRPADAGAVAAAVAALRAASDERARRAEVTAAEGRVRRRLTLRLGGLAAAVLVLGLAGVAVQWRRAAKESEARGVALADAEQARGQTLEALRQLTREPLLVPSAPRGAPTPDEAKMVREVLAIWEAVSDTRGDGREARVVRAEGLHSVGHYRSHVFEPGSGVDALRQAAAIRKQLADEFPDLPEYREAVALSRHFLGFYLAGSGRHVDAEPEYRAARELYERLTDEQPGKQSHRNALVAVWRHLGDLYAATGRPAEVEAAYRTSVAHAERLDADFPPDPNNRRLLASGHATLGWLFVDRGRLGEADTAYRRSVDLYMRLVADAPGEYWDRTSASDMCTRLGNLAASAGRLAEALDWHGKAIAVLDPPAADADRRWLIPAYGPAYAGRADVLDRLGRFTEAADDWGLAADASTDKAAFRVVQAMSLARAGRAEAAADRADELSRRPGLTGEQIYNTACVHGVLCDRRPESAARAMDLLRKAVAAGFRAAAHTAADPDLAPLRDRLDFKWLVAKMRTLPEPAPPPRPAR